jgi:hypothetical protein
LYWFLLESSTNQPFESFFLGKGCPDSLEMLLSRVLRRMAGGAEGAQVIFGVVATLAFTLFVMDL